MLRTPVILPWQCRQLRKRCRGETRLRITLFEVTEVFFFSLRLLWFWASITLAWLAQSTMRVHLLYEYNCNVDQNSKQRYKREFNCLDEYSHVVVILKYICLIKSCNKRLCSDKANIVLFLIGSYSTIISQAGVTKSLVHCHKQYEGVSKSFRTGRLERELQTVQLSATTCSYIAILWVSLMSLAAITLCVASQRVFIVVTVVYFVMDSVQKILDTPSYFITALTNCMNCHVIILWKNTGNLLVYKLL
jgi:hypothetical protein